MTEENVNSVSDLRVVKYAEEAFKVVGYALWNENAGFTALKAPKQAFRTACIMVDHWKVRKSRVHLSDVFVYEEDIEILRQFPSYLWSSYLLIYLIKLNYITLLQI